MAITRFRGEYAFLSNFYPVDIEYEGIVFPSVEHAYQATKTLDTDTRLLICRQTARIAKAMGRTFKPRDDWDAIKLGMMRHFLDQKFLANPDLGRRLAATYPEELVEANWWRDKFWGTFNGEGENHLGRLLMEVRFDAAHL